MQRIRVTSSGTNSASLTIDDFLAQVKKFPGANGPKQTYKLKAVPFENIVANWPVSDPLAPLTAEQKLTHIAEAAWGLTALIADSDYVDRGEDRPCGARGGPQGRGRPGRARQQAGPRRGGGCGRDPDALRRLVRNLLENARAHGQPPLEISSETTAAGVRLTVEDRGPGVPEAERERIFAAFYRPAGHREGDGGVGLGLALVRQIAGLHGGVVRCEARPGGGSRFVAELPRG